MTVDNEFTQLMKGLQGERLRQAFHFLDRDQDGFIKPDQFKRIIMVNIIQSIFILETESVIQELASHKLSQGVIDRLPTLCTLTPGGKISYSEVVAFHNVIRGVFVSNNSVFHHLHQPRAKKWTW